MQDFANKTFSRLIPARINLQASSGVAACQTEAQRVRHIQDSPELFYSDTMSAGDHENDHALVNLLVCVTFTFLLFL